MFAGKCINYLETYADELPEKLLTKIARAGKCSELFSRVPRKEQQQAIRDIYQHMTEWLLNQDRPLPEEYYVSIGMRRAAQGVPFTDLLHAVCAAREYFWEFVEQETLLDQPTDFWGGIRLLRSLDRWFDTILGFAAAGYYKQQMDAVRHT